MNFDSLPDPENRFELVRRIDTGSCAQVYLAKDKENDNKNVAVKMVEDFDWYREEVDQEHRTLQGLGMHENFPHYTGVFRRKDQIWFVMEYMSLGSVCEFAEGYRHNGERMSEELIAYILKEIAKALQDLHQANTIYRDLHGKNVVITQDGRIKLVDFGICVQLPNTMAKTNMSIGTPHWMAPEVIECQQKTGSEDQQQKTGSDGYDNRCDVWSLGITAIELGDGGVPPNADVTHPVRCLLHTLHNPPPTPKRISDWSNEFNDFINECLVKNPDHRPIMLEVLEHPFLSTVPVDTNQEKIGIRTHQTNGIQTSNLQPQSADIQPHTAFVRQGYLKTDYNSKPVKMVADDLAGLDHFNDEIVLETLFHRWQQSKIYTWVADVLISVNPFSDKCNYDEVIQKQYSSKSRSQNEPHLFAVSDRAHQDMLHHKQHQTIILSGEAGSGKTFNYHHLIKHLCYIGKSNVGLIKKVQNIGVVLDSFGNAHTELSSNSTRHLRYFDVTFSKTGKVSGAIVWLLALQKHRLTHRPRGEGNFHIFNYLYHGLSQTSRLSRYGLKLSTHYNYLPKHSYDNEVLYAQEFAKVEEALQKFIKEEEALQVIGFHEREIHTLYLVLSSILILGNVEFSGGDEATIKDLEPVEEVCRLLDIDEKKFIWCLCNKIITLPGRPVSQTKKTESEAYNERDSLVRTLYSRLVDFVVNTINIKLSVTRLVFGDPYAIGILDMSGFEANEHNSLDTMLINVANEQLQYYYNQYIFNWEMQDYAEEGIPIKNFTFPDNHHILQLYLSKPQGIFTLLENVTRENDGCDAHFAHQLKQQSTNKQLQSVSQYTFAIAHYVGRVKYDVHGFVEKNREGLSQEIVQTFRKSANEHLKSMFTGKLTLTGNLTMQEELENGNQKNKTFGISKKEKKTARPLNTKSKGKLSQTRQHQTFTTNFRYSLIHLLHRLTSASQPHFIRCIRSNMDSSPSLFDREMVQHQVKYHAVCDTIKIRQQGFSHRIPYQEFLRRYQFLAFEFDETVDVTKDNARLLLVRLKMEGWAIGEDKVFLKYYNEEFLSRLYESSVKKIVKIQAMMRAYMERKRKNRGWKREKVEEVKEEGEEEYRGFKARKENPEIAEKIKSREKFGEATLEGEAARYVQYYFRKWKMRTLFQQLNIYRADKQQQLVYFSQQVHLYGQELQA
ncbi:hypothetical protein Pcinc_018021, partial [Petrolisthes cinctipes]